MKTRKVLLLTSFLFCFHAYAQKKDSAVSAADHELNIYNKAIQFGDYEAAKNAMYSLIEMQPENNSYLDTLTRLYSSIGANNQVIRAGMACLKKDTSDDFILELVAMADNSLNHPEEALGLYERLHYRTKSPYYAYQVAYDQYSLQHYDESCKTLEAIIKDTAADKQAINITMEQNKSQRVPLKAAAYNLLGVAQLNLNMNDKANDNFEAALKLYPDFQLAKENTVLAKKPK